jgi:hypothetical protein
MAARSLRSQSHNLLPDNHPDVIVAAAQPVDDAMLDEEDEHREETPIANQVPVELPDRRQNEPREVPRLTPATEPRETTPANFQDTLLSLLGQSVSTKGTDVRPPDKFSGTDRSKFRTYIAQCRLVFRANPHKFNTDTKQVTYACSYLDGIAFQWYQNALELDEDPVWFDNWSLFKNELQSQFGEVNVEASAERNIRLLNMKHNDQITTYITKFHTYSNNLSWNDEALVSEFRRGLAGRIKDELQHIDHENWTLNDLEHRCLKIDYRYWERQSEKWNETSDRRVVTESTTTQKTFSSSHKHPRDKRSGDRSTTYRETSSKPVNTDKPLPLDKSGHLTADERQRRIDHHLCSYCGGKHELEKCPKKKDTRQNRENTRMATATFTIQGNE